MGAQRTRVTLQDVASAAGTSPSTASRVLHGGAVVTDALAERVRRAASGLGYSVNRQARSLRRGRDEAIGLAVEDFTIPFFGRIVSVVERAAHARGFGVVITVAGAGRSEAEAVEPLLSRSVAGLVVATGTAGAPHGYLAEVARDLPVVAVDAPGPSAVSDAVGIDNAGAGRQLTEHLLRGGHRELLLVGSGPLASTVELRREGFLAACADAGVRASSAWLGYDPAGAHDAAVAALAAAPGATAVLSAVARSTMGMASALRASGRRCAFAAVDDLAGADSLGLTVLEQDVEAMGERAAAMLFARIDGAVGPPRHHQVALRLLQRGWGEVAAAGEQAPSQTAALDPAQAPAQAPAAGDGRRPELAAAGAPPP